MPKSFWSDSKGYAICGKYTVKLFLCNLSNLAEMLQQKYIAYLYLILKALRHGSHSVTCNYTNACLYLVSVHQMAPPQTEVAHI